MRAASIFIDPCPARDFPAQLERKLQAAALSADAVFAFYDASYDGNAIARALSSRFPDAAIIGGSSSGGVMSQYDADRAYAAGFLLLEDADGDFGVGACPLGNDPAGAAEAALLAALEDADCVGELPELIWTYQAPGTEEDVIAGLRRVVGNRCPIVGGSSADDLVEGKWSQLSRTGAATDSVVVCALFPSRPLSYAFQGGYEPDGNFGRVTRIDGGRITKVEGARRSRIILEIDNEPAAQIYNRWSGGILDGKLASGGSILGETNLNPLSVLAGKENGVDQYVLVHPETVRPDGALTTFAEVAEGATIHCMRGEADQLLRRAGRVARQASSQLESEPCAALVVFCGGCRMAVQDRIAELSGSLREHLGDTPLVVCFTFGEQGPVLGVNQHGNLMISAVVFGA